ncbi:SCO family protein [bacterium]|nr:MAG: SCO family protein [bacterium]
MDRQPVSGIDVIEHLSDTIPLDLEFTDDEGKKTVLGDYFHQGKPVVIVLAYYNCPMLCTLVLNGVADAVKQNNWTPGEDYRIVTISIDSSETAELAGLKRKRYLEYLAKPEADAGWRFHVGDHTQIVRLADALGFKFFYDADRKEFAHPAVVFILGEDGKISRYLYGIQFNDRDFRLALVEASEGKVGNTLDRLLLYCFHYDPASKGYVVMAMNVMKLGGLATMLILGLFLAVMWKRDRTSKKE